MFSKRKLFKIINHYTSQLNNRCSGNKIYNLFSNAINSKQYDLPLDDNQDNKFLLILIALMSFLAVLSLSGAIALNSTTNKWSSGLENKITIEISVETKDGHILSQDTILKETKNLYDTLSSHPLIKSVNILSNEEIQDLISPWVGNDLDLTNIPLPSLISVEIKNIGENEFNNLKKDIKKASKHANIETHEQWLSDLIEFTKTLKILSLLVTLIIISITTIAITSAVKTRLAIHNEEVTLLHYMGATDNYIIRQFQRHTVILALKGAIIGTVLGIIVTLSLTFISRSSESDLIPVIYIGFYAIIMLCLVPVIIAIITALTSYITVLRSLAKMP